MITKPIFFQQHSHLYNAIYSQWKYITGEGSLEAYGLDSLTGSAGEVTVLEDIKDLCKGYKLGTDVSFTATYKGKFDSSHVQAAMESSTEESAEDVVVDVEAVSE